MTKGFDSKAVCNENYLRTKIKCYQEKVITNFHGEKIPCICLSVILINSVFTAGKNSYRQAF